MTFPFSYPDKPHARRHGPSGYLRYESYRPWLRDEFCFRCVYCLARETWWRMGRTFDIDHFLPVEHLPNSGQDYDNLLYACAGCNAT